MNHAVHSEIREQIHLGSIGFGEIVLILDHVLRLRPLFLRFGFHGVEFEVAQDGLGALDDDFRQTRQAGDLDAVGFVGGSGEDLVEEDDLLIPLSHGDVVVGDGALGVGEVG